MSAMYGYESVQMGPSESIGTSLRRAELGSVPLMHAHSSEDGSKEDEVLDFDTGFFDCGHETASKDSSVTSPGDDQVLKTSAAIHDVTGKATELPAGGDAAIDFMSAFIKEEVDSDLMDLTRPPEGNKVVAGANGSGNAAATTPKKYARASSDSHIKKRLNAHQRKAHNKIERKYRININSKIAHLQKLVPWMSNEAVAFEVDRGDSEGQALAGMEASRRLNKSMILDIVTKYVIHLKEENEILKQRLRTCEEALAAAE